MIRNQSYMPQSAVMPEHYQQMQPNPIQANMGPQAENKQPAPPSYHCYVDISQLHHLPYMHDFHHMHHYHPMMDHYHPMMDGFHPMMDDYHPMMDGFHPMMDDHHPMMDDFHPMMHGMWDEHMFSDHHHHYDGWEFTSLDYHHAWFHPMMHMHHHPYHFCLPVTCQPAGEPQEKEEVEKP